MWNLAAVCFALGMALSTGSGLPQEVRKAQEDRGLSELMPRVRVALQVDSARPVLQVSGRAERYGVPHPFRWTFSPQGHFLREFKGALAQSMGEDGARAWAQEVRSPSFPIVGTERLRLQAFAWLWSGAWCQAASPFELTLQGSAIETETIVLRYRLAGSELTGSIHLDPSTLYPQRLTFAQAHGGGQVAFEGWNPTQEPPMPGLVRLNSELDGELTFHVQNSQVWDRPPPQYGDPRATASDTGFLEGADPLVSAQRLANGNWIVRPLIDGKPRGPFLLDPSSPHSLMTQALGDSLGYRAFSTYPGGPTLAPGTTGEGLYQSRFLQLGPFLLEGPRYAQVNKLPKPFKDSEESCVGLLGWDVFLRSVVVFDSERETVELHDPTTLASDPEPWQAVQWIEMTLAARVPHLRLELGEQRAVLVRFDPQLQGAEVLLSGAIADAANASLAGRAVTTRPVELGDEFDRLGTPEVMGKFGPGALPPGALVLDYAHSRLGVRPVK